jgi:Leucine-rich repeat (LRR) protein
MDVVLDLQSLRLTTAQLDARLREVENPLTLQRLYLSNNELTAIPPCIGRFKNLWLLYASGNRLTEIGREVFELSSLTTLYLSCNELSFVPSAIGSLTNLRKLSLHTNHIDTLPTSISKLCRLDVLYLNNNPLPPQLNVNYYGSATNTAALIASASLFFRRAVPCRTAVLWTVLVFQRSKQLPPEVAHMIALQVWRTRNADDWEELLALNDKRKQEEEEPHE